MRFQEFFYFFYLYLDTATADNIILPALDAEAELFYFHNIIRYQGFGTNKRGIDDETAIFGLTDFHTIKRLIPFASLCAIDSSQGDMR